MDAVARSIAIRNRQSRGLRWWDVAMLVMAALTLLAIAATPALRTPAHTRATTVRVRSAETLWKIAERTRVPGLGTDDVVREIRRLNGLTSSDIAEGQVLRVPDAAAVSLAAR